MKGKFFAVYSGTSEYKLPSIPSVINVVSICFRVLFSGREMMGACFVLLMGQQAGPDREAVLQGW